MSPLLWCLLDFSALAVFRLLHFEGSSACGISTGAPVDSGTDSAVTPGDFVWGAAGTAGAGFSGSERPGGFGIGAGGGVRTGGGGGPGVRRAAGGAASSLSGTFGFGAAGGTDGPVADGPVAGGPVAGGALVARGALAGVSADFGAGEVISPLQCGHGPVVGGRSFGIRIFPLQ